MARTPVTWAYKIFNRFGHPWKPWGDEELHAAKSRIKSITPETCSVDDYILQIAYIANKYAEITNNVIKTEKNYRRLLSNIRVKVERNIRNPPEPTKRHQFISPTVEYFKAFIVPRLRLIGRIPETFLHADDDEFLTDLFEGCSEQKNQWFRQSFMFDKYGDENIDYQILTISAESAIHAFTTLIEAKLNGYTGARGLSAHDEYCQIANNLIHNKEYLIDDLLAAYTDPESTAPLLPHPECPHHHIDGGSHCRCTWQACLRPAPPGVDPKFDQWMKDELKKAGLPVP